MLAGLTGTGKTELLKELELRGACQVLDLEGLANHRGSLLGAVPETKGVTSSMDTQPSQKMFESYLVKALSALDPSKPVWLEAESSKIGQLQLPQALWAAMLVSPRYQVSLPLPVRVRRIIKEYPYWIANPHELKALLRRLTSTHSKKTIDKWCDLVDSRAWDEVVTHLLEEHYDPAYVNSMSRHEKQHEKTISLADINPEEVTRFVEEIS
uniref:tRNA 2-selenouridine synthase AAA domain-containing protein n=2 Tax=Octactis speculum TaxID=3111310 RepID=A0A7S2DA27_9STRA|mmetsp:Transcript_44645/g.61014  ORF Transcript_44645/g.61014 Transcript_44645/m.61014 type:complete len:211 (+) Transcript_44645:115-747(+)